MDNFSKFGTKYGVLYFISYFKFDENSVIITVYFIVNLKNIYLCYHSKYFLQIIFFKYSKKYKQLYLFKIFYFGKIVTNVKYYIEILLISTDV